MENKEAGYSRTLDEINETLRLATINESGLNNVTQVLYTTPGQCENHSIKLLELDEHLLDAIARGETISFRGTKSESAVLCTKSRTYDLKEAETSNSCLLVPKFKMFSKTDNQATNRKVEKRNIAGIFHTYFEVEECTPKLEKLVTLLEASSFKGSEYESEIDSEALYDWDRLRNEIQASEDELSQALNDYIIVNIDGYLRLTSFECEARSVTFMLDVFDEHSWELDKVDREITYECLKELVPKPVFDILFKKYSEPSEKSKEDGTRLYRYDKEQCCKILAKVLLAASPATEYKQFMESWRIGAPEKMPPKEEYLRGIALITCNDSVMKKEVVSFPEADLPKSINERLDELFKTRDKWTVPEITPYILSLTTNKMNVNALLTKYARCSAANGIKYYSSKHGK